MDRIVVLGHKDHGKSTLIGQLLIQTNSVFESRIAEAKRASKRLGKKFEPAFLLDSFSEERAYGLTLDTTRAELKYKGAAYEFIDVPGHKELIQNMITGASYADSAILVVSAKAGEGFKDQTRRHVFIANMLGIDFFIVAVNKLDAVGYSEQAFNKIKGEVEAYLKAVGINNFVFVPVSAYTGENLVALSKNMKWYKGKPLLEILHSRVHKKGHGHERQAVVLLHGTVEGERERFIAGRVISGKLSSKQQLLLLPENKKVTLLSLLVKGKKSRQAKKGENIAAKLSVDVKEPKGKVLASTNADISVGKKLPAKILTVSGLSSKLQINFNGVLLACKIGKLGRKTDILTGKPYKHGKIFAAECELELSKPIVYSSFAKYPELGRFILLSDGNFSGFGIVNNRN